MCVCVCVCTGRRHQLTVSRNLQTTMKMSGLTLKENVRHNRLHVLSVIAWKSVSLSISFISVAAKKLKKDKLGMFSSPGRVKSGRGPGRPPKHPRVEDTSSNPPSSDLLTLKVRNILVIYTFKWCMGVQFW